MTAVVERLPLASELRAALLEHRGTIGEALACTLAYERGDWGRVRCGGLPRAAIKAAFLEAVDWVERTDHELTSLAA